jgi:peptide/nickel transport system permease protein
VSVREEARAGPEAPETQDFGAPLGAAPTGIGTGPKAERGIHKLLRAIARNRTATAGVVILAFFTIVAVVPQWFAPYNPGAMVFGPGLGASAKHWLGTTTQGQDVYSQLVWGTRQTLVIAVAVGGLSTIVAVLVGVTSAYLGGFTDGVLSLITDVILVIPTFPLIIVIASYERNSGLLTIIIVLGALGWSYGARQLRSQVLSLRSRDFLEAARVRGERSSYIILFEILPTMTSLIVATFLGGALYAVLAAAGLQFVGLGDPNSQSWGTMLYWAQNADALQIGMPLWALMPGVCVALLGAGFALLNYAFDEIGNPALRPVRRKLVADLAIAQPGLDTALDQGAPTAVVSHRKAAAAAKRNSGAGGLVRAARRHG